jgi:hypothetical protein
MAEIARFYGIIISMFGSEDNPQHFHLFRHPAAGNNFEVASIICRRLPPSPQKAEGRRQKGVTNVTIVTAVTAEGRRREGRKQFWRKSSLWRRGAPRLYNDKTSSPCHVCHPFLPSRFLLSRLRAVTASTVILHSVRNASLGRTKDDPRKPASLSGCILNRMQREDVLAISTERYILHRM